MPPGISGEIRRNNCYFNNKTLIQLIIALTSHVLVYNNYHFMSIFYNWFPYPVNSEIE
jgi:hypothetical protein